MTTEKEKAKFIALEGGEGAGKSTQARILTDRLQANGIPTIQIHEPGTTSLGLHLRAFLKGNHPINPEAEMLLFGASRAQLVDEIIQPKLEQGVTVIADRFEASGVAYQGHGRRMLLADVEMINAFATKGIHPDLNILLDPRAEDRTGPDQEATAGRRDGTGRNGNPARPGGNPPVRGAAHRLPPEGTSWIPSPGQDETRKMGSDRRDDVAGAGARGDLGKSSRDTEMTSCRRASAAAEPSKLQPVGSTP